MNFEQNYIINPWAKLDECLNTKLHGGCVERLSQTKIRFHPSSTFPNSNLMTKHVILGEDLTSPENDEYFKK